MTTVDATTPLTGRQQTLYASLAKEIHAMGLMRRRYGYYWTKMVVLALVIVSLVALHVVVGPSWWQLGIAGLLAVAVTQAAFLGHDAAHRQIFRSARWSEWTSRTIGAVFVGMSYGWWNSKHNRHHGAPNQVGKDPDIGPGAVAWTPEIADERRGLSRWLTRRQGWFFFPLLLLAGASLVVSGFRVLTGSRPVKHRWLELGVISARVGGFLALVFLVLPPGMAVAFIAVNLAVFGLYLGGSFAPNHIGMPIVPRGATVDFLRRQVLMSRNIRGGRLVESAMGGLNYQIEHHLFPSMPRPALRKAAPVVRAFCQRHGISYTQTSLLEAYGRIRRYVDQVGLGSQDPFRCPLVQQYRPV